MQLNNLLNKFSLSGQKILTAILITFVLTGCGGTRAQPAQKNIQPIQLVEKKASQNIPVQILNYSLIKSPEKIPLGGGSEIKIENNKVSNKQKFLGPPDEWASAKPGNQFVVISLNIVAQNEKEWNEVVTSAQLVDQIGNSKYADLWYFNDAFRRINLLTFGLLDFNPGQQTKIAFHMNDPLPPKISLKIQNKEIVFLEDIQKN